jgi:hypothetical protein
MGHLVRQQAGQWVNARYLRMPPANSVGNVQRGLPRPVRVPSLLPPLGQIALNSPATPVGKQLRPTIAFDSHRTHFS